MKTGAPVSRSLRLQIPEPPASLPYADYEDYRHPEILKLNGIQLQPKAILRALREEKGVLRTAAAHTAGSMGLQAAVPLLQVVAADKMDDISQVEAAYALVRLGHAEAHQVLLDALTHSLEAGSSSLVAAGYLARLGDTAGWPVVQRAFQEDNIIIRVVASKQLTFFVPFNHQPASDGQPIQVSELFERALADNFGDVKRSALVQLADLPSPESERILSDFIASSSDKDLRDIAQVFLDRMKH